MTLKEVEVILEDKITITETLDDRFCASFNAHETSDGRFLRACCGFGITKEEALERLAKRMSNARVVTNPFSDKRKEISIPGVTV